MGLRSERGWPEAKRLMTHPGVGSLTALAFVLIIGTTERFGSGKTIASYLGLVPSEESSGDRRRLGHITKQGNSLLSFLLVESAQVTVHYDPSLDLANKGSVRSMGFPRQTRNAKSVNSDSSRLPIKSRILIKVTAFLYTALCQFICRILS
jgi:hypothetical protein